MDLLTIYVAVGSKRDENCFRSWGEALKLGSNIEARCHKSNYGGMYVRTSRCVCFCLCRSNHGVLWRQPSRYHGYINKSRSAAINGGENRKSSLTFFNGLFSSSSSIKRSKNLYIWPLMKKIRLFLPPPKIYSACKICVYEGRKKIAWDVFFATGNNNKLAEN